MIGVGEKVGDGAEDKIVAVMLCRNSVRDEDMRTAQCGTCLRFIKHLYRATK